ncbi:hypothetical protein PABG_12118 [Paracoccidioides brasiliensis Pb03]|uniref:Uncharacterized protein n=1 Tax=Paracoccidioides brasiliensis (strain Pb18) TaxID=502780 RepID=A0A0A0HUH0_PARBD|nr:uncharacterized protein PADG_12231 [Paracoccidioides brasiliensis Pb18]KGM91661.1 hypothetical protein PADG_12231 [Paracoccidioides brasiliensis Pb18]KGY15004.1 hypothetical protein PABG_12118 [Paracoccidioides brasiliensis Pb03]
MQMSPNVGRHDDDAMVFKSIVDFLEKKLAFRFESAENYSLAQELRHCHDGLFGKQDPLD